MNAPSLEKYPAMELRQSLLELARERESVCSFRKEQCEAAEKVQQQAEARSVDAVRSIAVTVERLAETKAKAIIEDEESTATTEEEEIGLLNVLHMKQRDAEVRQFQTRRPSLKKNNRAQAPFDVNNRRVAQLEADLETERDRVAAAAQRFASVLSSVQLLHRNVSARAQQDVEEVAALVTERNRLTMEVQELSRIQSATFVQAIESTKARIREEIAFQWQSRIDAIPSLESALAPYASRAREKAAGWGDAIVRRAEQETERSLEPEQARVEADAGRNAGRPQSDTEDLQRLRQDVLTQWRLLPWWDTEDWVALARESVSLVRMLPADDPDRLALQQLFAQEIALLRDDGKRSAHRKPREPQDDP